MRKSICALFFVSFAVAACGGSVGEPDTRGPGGLGLGSGSGSSSVGTGSGSGTSIGSGSGGGCGDFVECPCDGLPVCVDGEWQCDTICVSDAGPPPYDAEPWDAEPWDGGYDAEPWDAEPWDGGYPDVIILPDDAGACYGEPPYCVGACGQYVSSFCDGDGNWACEPTPPCEPLDGGSSDGWVGTLPP